MSHSNEDILLKIAQIDEIRRPKKAERLVWLYLHEVTKPTILIGRSETLKLLSETREAFLDGHDVATLLLGISFIEHTIIEELQQLKLIKDSPSFSKAIQIAKDNKVFPIDWLDRTKKLSLYRNPFAHLKDSLHEHNLGNRAVKKECSPYELLEENAKGVIDLMNNFFTMTLREMKL